MQAIELPRSQPHRLHEVTKISQVSPSVSPGLPQDIEEYPLMKEDAHSPIKRTKRPITLTFKDLSFSVPVKGDNGEIKETRREILKGLTGICRPGELTAIMGASGAGKTTLLNILSVRTTGTDKNKLGGGFFANGHPYDVGRFSKFAGYVMQNDILLETMTPREIFQFTADLRLTDDAAERKRKVNQLLSDLKLTRAADTLVGGNFRKGISGGERKRTSIGVELITDPNLLFLDEPTSGLDSFTAFVLINLLKSLAVRGGKTIIFTIHQPSSDIFFLFDSLMILAKGKFIYQGPTSAAVSHFGSFGFQCPDYSNPADYFIDIAHSNGNDDDKFEKMYHQYDTTRAPAIMNEVEQTMKAEIPLATKANGFVTSCGLIARRSFLDFMRNPIHLQSKIGQTIFLTFLICCIFFKLSKDPLNSRALFDINGSLFFFGMSVFMSGAMSVVLTFPSERAVFLREYSANMYSVSSYYFGRSCIEIPFVVLFPIVMTAVSYYIIQYNTYSVAKFFIFMLILIFMSLAGNAVGLLVGSAFSDPKVASNVVPAVILPWMLFSGFFINASSIPVWLRWLIYVSPFHYSLEAFMWNEYSDSPFGTSPLAEYSFDLGLWAALGILAGLGLLFRAASLLALKNLVRKLE